MRVIFLTAATALALPLPLDASAAPFDGSQPMVCAMLEVLECERGLSCEEQTVDNVDAPQFLQISVPDKTVVGTRPSGAPVDAKIELVRHAEQQLFLQGVEKTRGWSMAINEAKGGMTLAIHDDASSYVIFGACTPR
jgi:hypothetical protein